jgi:hypothetical protein
MQRRPQEVAAGVAGEDPTGSIAAVGRRREPEQQDPRIRITEARDGPAPVRLVAEPGDPLPRDSLAPFDQPRAPAALDDLGLDLGQGSPSCLGLLVDAQVRAPSFYLSSSLSSRRDTIASPMRPITSR